MEPISGETATAGPLNQNSKVFQNMSAHKSRMRKSLSRLLLLDNTSSLGLRQIDSRSLKNEGTSSGCLFCRLSCLAGRQGGVAVSIRRARFPAILNAGARPGDCLFSQSGTTAHFLTLTLLLRCSQDKWSTSCRARSGDREAAGRRPGGLARRRHHVNGDVAFRLVTHLIADEMKSRLRAMR
jgi:hypothetical protein